MEIEADFPSMPMVTVRGSDCFPKGSCRAHHHHHWDESFSKPLNVTSAKNPPPVLHSQTFLWHKNPQIPTRIPSACVTFYMTKALYKHRQWKTWAISLTITAEVTSQSHLCIQKHFKEHLIIRALIILKTNFEVKLFTRNTLTIEYHSGC